MSALEPARRVQWIQADMMVFDVLVENRDADGEFGSLHLQNHSVDLEDLEGSHVIH